MIVTTQLKIHCVNNYNDTDHHGLPPGIGLAEAAIANNYMLKRSSLGMEGLKEQCLHGLDTTMECHDKRFT